MNLLAASDGQETARTQRPEMMREEQESQAKMRAYVDRVVDLTREWTLDTFQQPDKGAAAIAALEAAGGPGDLRGTSHLVRAYRYLSQAQTAAAMESATQHYSAVLLELMVEHGAFNTSLDVGSDTHTGKGRRDADADGGDVEREAHARTHHSPCVLSRSLRTRKLRVKMRGDNQSSPRGAYADLAIFSSKKQILLDIVEVSAAQRRAGQQIRRPGLRRDASLPVVIA